MGLQELQNFKGDYMKKLLLLVLTLLAISSTAYAAPDDLKRNDQGTTVLTSVNLIPGYGGLTKYGELLVAGKPGLVACSTAVTNTTPTNILAGASGVGHIISSVWCHNNSSTGSIVTITNGGSIYLGTTAIGNNKHVFEYSKPLYLVQSIDLQLTMTTTSTSTICCANYINDTVVAFTPTATPTITPTATVTLTPTVTPTP